MSTLRERIHDDVKSAMRAGEKEKLATLRLITAAIKQREVDDRIALNNQLLNDEQVLAVLDKMVKQRRESIAQYEAGNRPDLAEKEIIEIQVIQAFLPPQLSETEIAQLIDAAIKEAGATSARDMGKVMGILKPRLQGRADIGVVSSKIKARLAPPA